MAEALLAVAAGLLVAGIVLIVYQHIEKRRWEELARRKPYLFKE